MRRIILIYGGIAGAIVILSMILGFTLGGSDSAYATEAFGYLIMLVALSMIFMGIKKHRDDNLGGVIKFLPAFLLGLGIAAVAGVVYVVIWEIHLAMTDHAFINEYVAEAIKAKEAGGLSGAALEAEIEKMEQLKAQYGNVFYRVSITFLEIFRLGFVVALLSALLLCFSNILPKKAG
jgi:amino acid transporter